MTGWALEIVIDPIACDGRGLCAELLPERIQLDPWGFPIFEDKELTPALYDHALRAAKRCPMQAIHLVERRC